MERRWWGSEGGTVRQRISRPGEAVAVWTWFPLGGGALLVLVSLLDPVILWALLAGLAWIAVGLRFWSLGIFLEGSSTVLVRGFVSTRRLKIEDVADVTIATLDLVGGLALPYFELVLRDGTTIAAYGTAGVGTTQPELDLVRTQLLGPHS